MAQAGKYIVHVTTDEPPIYYDNDGKGYAFSNAKTFARIGSKRRKDGSWGEDRAVSRGKRGPVIRVYHHGEKLWPLYASQVNKLVGSSCLTANEMPRKLIFDELGDTGFRTVKVVKVGQSTRVVPASHPWRERFLKLHPSWR